MPELIEWPCQFPSCQNQVLRTFAICDTCFEVRCNTHNTPEDHVCKSFKTRKAFEKKANESKRSYLKNVIQQVRQCSNIITQEVNQLNPHHQCRLIIPDNIDQLLKSGLFAGFNVHFAITFDDGSKWLLRVRQDHIPFDYFFYEFLEGTTWQVPKTPFFAIDLPEDKLVKLIEGCAKIQMQLSLLSIPVNEIGCLSSDEAGKLTVGPFIARGCFQTPKSPYLLGPFGTMKDRYLAHIYAALWYIAANAVSWQSPVDAYIWHLELKELVTNSQILANPVEEVFIKHDDERGDHFMWDIEENIVGVLDWEWAYATCKGEAFAAPHIFYECLAFIRGQNQLTKEENILIDIYEKNDRLDLADCVRNGRLYQRLAKIGLYNPAFTRKGFMEPFGLNPAPEFDPPNILVDWRIYMMMRYQVNEGLQEMLKKHDYSIEKAQIEAVKWHKDQKEQQEQKEKKRKELGEDRGKVQ
ncbi:uncharacterized protein L201_003066 [Kwoniella dendrophila CBS 6074]|uniref:Aminoglycoside phosphotransferase domain-containing protein n=1 Tax=Kwoniella dendrophila CBS 6074 TaxID=1295534 RepID=A0AAX4JSM3_9TREE